AVRGRVEALGRDARALAGAKVAAVGPATEAALRGWGIVADLVPGRATTADLGAAFPGGSGRVLLPRADIANPELTGALRAKGWTCEDVVAYRTVPAAGIDLKARKRPEGGE